MEMETRTTGTKTAALDLHPAFRHDKYLFRRKVFKLFGGAFHIYDAAGNLAFYSKQKAFALKEDFRIYADESCQNELLVIKTPHILDINAVYHVKAGDEVDTIGSLKRKGLRSILKDEWSILSKDDEEIGKLTETSIAGALLSRLINLIPQNYSITSSDGKTVAYLRQHFNPFVLKYTLTLETSVSPIDPRLLIAAGILLAGIERKQG